MWAALPPRTAALSRSCPASNADQGAESQSPNLTVPVWVRGLSLVYSAVGLGTATGPSPVSGGVSWTRQPRSPCGRALGRGSPPAGGRPLCLLEAPCLSPYPVGVPAPRVPGAAVSAEKAVNPGHPGGVPGTVHLVFPVTLSLVALLVS